ncbi:MAG: hypothetical protein JF615_15760, partial [Asticcacaulis sp.]|nr:hypothetical protein [Asticcacaulis sp.]
LAAMWAVIFWQVGPKEGYRVAVETQGMRELDAAPDAEQALTVHQRALPYILALGTAYYVVNTISFGLWRAWYYSLGALVVGVTILVIKAVDTQMKLRTQQ